MKRHLSKLLFTIIATIGIQLSASAVPLTWTLGGATFSDGGTASGSFTYDADTNTYSAINIITTTGTVVTGATFTFICVAPCTGLAPGPGNALVLTASSSSNLTGTPALALLFGPPLSNSGGGRSVSFGQQARCSDAVCSAPTGPQRTLTAGTVTAPGLPPRLIPTLSGGSLALLALMIGFAAVFSRRRLSRG